MNKLLAYCLFAAIGIASCTSKPKAGAAPSDLIPRDSFVVILTEVRLLEGAYSTSYERVDTSEFTIASYYQRLFREHNITREQYLNSYDYYSKNLDDLPAIESEVAKRLEEMQLPADTLRDVKSANP